MASSALVSLPPPKQAAEGMRHAVEMNALLWSVNMIQYSLVWVLALLVGLCLRGTSWATPNLVEDALEMKVKGVAMDPYGNTPMVILEDATGRQAFPIWIGLPEAQAIARTLENVATPRPMTHALLKNILTDLHVEVAHIVIHDLQSNTFYASIALRQGAKTLTVDARPSDAITLALDAKAPIFVSKKVLGSVRTVNLSPPSLEQHFAKKLGMHLQSLDTTLAQAFHLTTPEGVLVSFVEAGSQAERHGIRRGDVITKVDGQQVKDLPDLLEAVKHKTGGKESVLQVTRDQHPLKLRLPSLALD
jgi:bifunctional DNase/RNase